MVCVRTYLKVHTIIVLLLGHRKHPVKSSCKLLDLRENDGLRGPRSIEYNANIYLRTILNYNH